MLVSLVSGKGHYDEVVRPIEDAKRSVWIATANLKELMVEDPRVHSGRRRASGRGSYRSVLKVFDELSARGVELRILHAQLAVATFSRRVRVAPALAGPGARGEHRRNFGKSRKNSKIR